MANYQTPGIYIEEIPKLPPVILPVETALPAFIGYSEKAAHDDLPLALVPTQITSLLEYETYFGGAPAQDVTVWLDARNIMVNAKVNRPFYLHDSVRLFFDNGGGPCMIVSVGNYENDISQAALAQGLAAIAKLTEPTMIAIPEAVATEDHGRSLYAAALLQCKSIKNRITICELAYQTETVSFMQEVDDFRDGIGIDNLKHGAAYGPWIVAVYARQIWLSNITLKRRGDNTIIAPESLTTDPKILALIADIHAAEKKSPLPKSSLPKLSNTTLTNNAARNLDMSRLNTSSRADIKLSVGKDLNTLNKALYAQFDLFKTWSDKASEILNTLPVSGAIAGIYTNVDKTRGVWKAPANVAINNVAKPVLNITDGQQSSLNVHETGKSINAIRAFTGKGTLVWGARTLAGNDNEWRYINTRRFFNFVETSILTSTNALVFEANDANTWVRVQAMIENFLTLLWREGALQGSKPEHAFFVNVGLNKTMSALDILEGRMIIEVGMAVVRPAEFIIFKMMHQMAES